MSGICSAHQGHDSQCSRCNALLRIERDESYNPPNVEGLIASESVMTVAREVVHSLWNVFDDDNRLPFQLADCGGNGVICVDLDGNHTGRYGFVDGVSHLQIASMFYADLVQ